MYCCIFPENYGIAKGRLIRLLVAEGLTKENAGQIVEDVAEDNINDLVSQGMLLVDDGFETMEIKSLFPPLIVCSFAKAT